MKRIILIAALVAGTFFMGNAQEIKSQWNGKRVAILGDSISDPALAENAGWKCWWAYLEDMMGIKAMSYARNGWQMDGMVKQAQSLYDQRAMDVDAIIIFCGTNDFNASVPLGEWYSEEIVQTVKDGAETTLKHRTLVMSGDTFCGRVNILMNWLRTNYPEKQVILLTPLHRGYASFGKTNVQPDELYANCNGDYIGDFAAKIREAGSVWSVPVIDLNAISGIIPNNPEHTRYINKTDTDRLHTSSAGHKRMAAAIAYQLLAYPASF